MLRRRLSKLTSVLSDLNCVIGGLSFLALFTGSLAAIIGVGGYSLEKLGVLEEEETWEQVWAFAIVSSTVGLAGSSVAATAGAFLSCRNIQAEDNKCTPASNNLDSSTSFKLAITRDMFVICRDDDKEEESKPETYTYYFVEIKGNPSISGLMVSRMQSNSVAICDCISLEDEKRLMLIHENPGESPRLIEKTFSSYQPLPTEALREHLEIYNPYLYARQSKNFEPCNLESCKGCQHLHGKDKIVCGIYAYGWNGFDCPDKVWDKRSAIRRFEDEAAIESLSKGLDDWKIFKYDYLISLFHPKTYRQFSFDFDGKLLSYSKTLAGLEEGNIVDYVYFLRRSRQFQYDYSHTDFIEQASFFLDEVDATISVDDFKIFVKEKDSNIVHTFLHNGEPFFVNKPACPPKLKDNYNLSTLIDYLYNDVGELDS